MFISGDRKPIRKAALQWFLEQYQIRWLFIVWIPFSKKEQRNCCHNQWAFISKPSLAKVQRRSTQWLGTSGILLSVRWIRDRSFEQQRYRVSGLNLVTAAIVLWNTVYLERIVNALRAHGEIIDESLLQYLSPLGWEHINLTGDYVWRTKKVGAGKFRPIRIIKNP